MLHTPVVQSEPNTFTPEVFPALHPHPVYPASGSGEEAAGKKTKHPLLVGLNRSLGFLRGQQQLQQDVGGQAAGRLVSAQQQQPVVVGLRSIAQDPAVVTQKI